jgi:hypothetical protein
VSNIVPFFLHNFPEDLLRDFFHSEALARAKSIIWNAETREAESADDLYLQNSGDGIDDFDVLETMGTSGDTTDYLTTPPQTDRVERLFYGEESDSIGTLFTTNQNVTTTNNAQTRTNNQDFTPIIKNQSERRGGSSVSGHSSGTIFTNEDSAHQIILLTEGLKNLEFMFMAVMQQQGISIDKSKFSNSIRTTQQLGTGTRVSTTNHSSPTPRIDKEQVRKAITQTTEDTHVAKVDQFSSLVNQGQK